MEQFDTFYFGTSVTDSINSSSLPKNSLVLDNQQSYGTTYPKQSVHNSKYLKNFKIIKDTNSQLNIEVSLGVLFKGTDSNFDNRKDLIFDNQFIKLQPLIHYFYDKSKTLIPNSLTTIVDCKYMTKLDKRMFVKCLEDKSKLTNLSSNFKSFLYKSFLVTERNNFKNKESFLEYFINNFSKPFFYYPIFGMSDISEHLSRTNAFKGIGYLLQDNLEVSKEINTEYGLIKCNTIIPYKLTGKYFCKVIHSLREEESFFMVTSDCVRIIGLNNLFFHCKEGMIYFVWSDKEITNHIYSVIGVNENEITYDVEFISLLEDECIFK